MAKVKTTLKHTEKTDIKPKTTSDEILPSRKTNLLFSLLERLNASRIILLICLVSCLAYASSLGGDFLYDDAEQIVENKELRSWNNLGRAFTTHVWAFRERPEALSIPVPPPYYRPLFTILFTVEYQLFGLWPQGWHLVSLLLHILCSVGVYYVLLLLAKRKNVAVVAALLFAVYSIHVESVSWISGITDPLFGVFFLASFYYYLRYRAENRRSWLIWSLILFALSAFSKETGLSLVGLIFIYEWIEVGEIKDQSSIMPPPKLWARIRASLLASLPYLGVAMLYLIPRYVVLGGIGWDNPHTYKGPAYHALFTIPWVLCSYILHLLWPANLTIAYNTSFVTSPATARFIIPMAALLLLVGGLVVYRKKVSKEVWYALALGFKQRESEFKMTAHVVRANAGCILP